MPQLGGEAPLTAGCLRARGWGIPVAVCNLEPRRELHPSMATAPAERLSHSAAIRGVAIAEADSCCLHRGDICCSNTVA